MFSARRMLASALFTILVACGGANTPIRYAFTMDAVAVQPPSLLVAHKDERTLYLVLDPQRVRDLWQIDFQDGSKATLTKFQEFVTRDLKHALENYYVRVEVMSPQQALPQEAHVVADVKVDAVKLHEAVGPGVTVRQLEMTWAFALRPSEARDYEFSYAGTDTSSSAYPSIEAGMGQLIESSITSMLSKWSDAKNKAHQAAAVSQ